MPNFKISKIYFRSHARTKKKQKKLDIPRPSPIPYKKIQIYFTMDVFWGGGEGGREKVWQVSELIKICFEKLIGSGGETEMWNN